MTLKLNPVYSELSTIVQLMDMLFLLKFSVFPYIRIICATYWLVYNIGIQILLKTQSIVSYITHTQVQLSQPLPSPEVLSFDKYHVVISLFIFNISGKFRMPIQPPVAAFVFIAVKKFVQIRI